MQEEHRRAIQKNFSSLVEQTDLETVVSSLYEKNVFSREMIEPYKDKSKGERDRKRQLYRDIERRGPKAFQALVDTLTEIGNWELVRALHPRSPLQPHCPIVHTPPYKKEPSPPLPEFNSITKRNQRNKVENETIMNMLFSKNVVKSTKFMDYSSDGKEVYSTRSRHRGALLIFSFIEFENNIEKYRRGAEVDCENLKHLFNEIGFHKPVVYTNLKKAEMLNTISALDKVDALLNVDCVFVMVSSHGYERSDTSDTDIRCSDGGLISTFAIIERFNNHRCPKLKNIPKIFIFQICRGTNMELLPPPSHMPQPNYRVEADGYSNQGPPYSDILIVHSTLPGFVSYRDPVLGSFYIQALCEVFAAHAHDHHIKDLFELVDEKLKEKLKEKYFIQTSSVDSWGFNKKLYLHPGLFED